MASLLSHLKDKYFNLSVKLHGSRFMKVMRFALFGAALFEVSQSALAANPPGGGTDMLASSWGDVTTNFGPNSDAAKLVYLIEGVCAIGLYMKTRNLTHLLGIVILGIFSYVIFTLIGAS